MLAISQRRLPPARPYGLRLQQGLRRGEHRTSFFSLQRVAALHGAELDLWMVPSDRVQLRPNSLLSSLPIQWTQLVAAAEL